jgi:hypothetical protein
MKAPKKEISMKLQRAANAGDAALRTGMIAVLSQIDGSGFHGIDMALRTAAPTIDHAWQRNVHNAHIAAAVLDWPKELQALATTFEGAAGRLTAALSRGDTQAAAEAAKDAHAAQHALSNGGWGYLGEAAGMPTEGDSHQHGHPH